jgi:hypothetical protein
VRAAPGQQAAGRRREHADGQLAHRRASDRLQVAGRLLDHGQDAVGVLGE